MSKIIITRDSGYADRLRKYKVIVNGKVVGTIGNGESKEFGVCDGNNEVFLKIDWCRSNKIIKQINSGDIIHYKGSSSLRGIHLQFALFYALFMPHKYLRLESCI